MFSAVFCFFIVPGFAHSPGVTGQVGNDILQDLLQILIHLKHIRTNKYAHITSDDDGLLHLCGHPFVCTCMSV